MKPPTFYDLPTDTLVILINEAMNGPPERRVAAKLLLDCLRTHAEIAACLEEAERYAILDVVKQAQTMAAALGITK